ncbi:hypothetical protein BDV96DRAFT_648172 [Lophiotrema nucula]|uniref:Uncharacterized protein n=1 Tax=Lophiotrema nucula TaxID=690887 RepID=A0A6A5Z1D7_9PLEO|nr:hypothetical protein BDV96DRAFT_648172 [Lophiotrema nucula]
MSPPKMAPSTGLQRIVPDLAYLLQVANGTREYSAAKVIDGAHGLQYSFAQRADDALAAGRIKAAPSESDAAIIVKLVEAHVPLLDDHIAKFKIILGPDPAYETTLFNLTTAIVFNPLQPRRTVTKRGPDTIKEQAKRRAEAIYNYSPAAVRKLQTTALHSVVGAPHLMLLRSATVLLLAATYIGRLSSDSYLERLGRDLDKVGKRHLLDEISQAMQWTWRWWWVQLNKKEKTGSGVAELAELVYWFRAALEDDWDWEEKEIEAEESLKGSSTTTSDEESCQRKSRQGRSCTSSWHRNSTLSIDHL